ncbi:MAG: folate family ECF transporter S component [Clostridia bacterium]|nr:folate family ECF transporter S component [Clostridia bacterium]
MQKNEKNERNRTKLALFGSLKVMVMSAMLCAMSVVIGIFCKSFLNFGGGLFRITFENLPILLSGIMFGPIVGGIVGAATDIISYFLSGQVYPINLLVTLGATAIGVVSGFCARYVFKRKGALRIVLSCSVAHMIGSMIIKPIGLFTFYSWTVLWRVPLYLVIAPLEIVILCMMYRNHTVRRLIDGGFGE